MNMPLSWNDLIISDIPEKECRRCLSLWAFMLSGKVSLVFMSKFGDWYLRRPDGSTEELSVIEGTLKQIAETPEEFQGLVNNEEWQEEHLLSYQVWLLHEKGVVPANNQCYGLAPHPCFTGTIDIEKAVILDIYVWQSICASLFQPVIHNEA
jgi:hypothetical protein